MSAAAGAIAPLSGLALLATVAAAAAAVVVHGPRRRALATLATLGLAPLALLGELWGTEQLAPLRERPLLLAAGLVVAAGAVAALAALLLRRPGLLAPLAVGALPFRLPLEAGGQTANLLVPLYVVVAAGGVAYAWERLRPAGGDGAPPRIAPDERRAGPIELVLVGVLVLYGVQALYSTDPRQALEYVAFFYAPFLLLFKLLAGVRWSRRLLARCVAVATALAVVFVLIGFVEFATRRLLLNPKVIASNQFESYFRVNSLFFDPNIYGRFLAIVMLALAGVLVWARSVRSARLAAALLALLWAGLVLSFSQSSFAALLVGLATLAALRWGPRPIAAAAGAAALAGVLLLLAAPGLLRVDILSARSLDRATSGRVDLIGGGLAMFADRPLWGFGSGSFAERYGAREEASSAEAVSASHTIPVTVAAEQGVIGLAAYLLLLWTAARALADGLGHALRRAAPPFGLAARGVVLAASAALVLHTLVYAAFLEDPLAWTLLGIGVALARGLPADPESAATAPAPGRTRAAAA